MPTALQKTKKPQVLAPEKPLLDIAEGLTKADWYFDLVEGYEIPDADEYAVAADLVKQVAAEVKVWEEQQELATRKLKDEYDMRRAVFSPIIKRLKTTKDKLKAMVGAYALKLAQEQQRKMLEVQNAATPSEKTELMRDARATTAPEKKGITNKFVNVAELEDIEQVPEKYLRLVVDMELVQADVDAGVKDIPGIRIEQRALTTVRR